MLDERRRAPLRFGSRGCRHLAGRHFWRRPRKDSPPPWYGYGSPGRMSIVGRSNWISFARSRASGPSKPCPASRSATPAGRCEDRRSRSRDQRRRVHSLIQRVDVAGTVVAHGFKSKFSRMFSLKTSPDFAPGRELIDLDAAADSCAPAPRVPLLPARSSGEQNALLRVPRTSSCAISPPKRSYAAYIAALRSLPAARALCSASTVAQASRRVWLMENPRLRALARLAGWMKWCAWSTAIAQSCPCIARWCWTALLPSRCIRPSGWRNASTSSHRSSWCHAPRHGHEAAGFPGRRRRRVNSGG